MSTERTNAYDEVSYPSAAYSQTHPSNLAAIAILRGMQPAPIESCRVLELGCGDGANLISLAYALPGSAFTGIDLAARPIARGSEVAAQLGLVNITLAERDVAELGPELGEFDFIIAHGLYSWVPPAVRERVMALCSRALAPQGVAFISYNAYPGNHLRDLVRGMMRYHAKHFEKPADQIAQSRALVRMLSTVGEESDPYRQILTRELERVSKYTDAAFFHDDLSPCNQPFYFHEFIAHAERNGLQFLAEADVTDQQELDCPPHVRAVLDQLDPSDVNGGEQYRDFVRCRAFRQTLLCRRNVSLARDFEPSALARLFIAGDVRPESAEIVPSDAKAEIFIGRKNAELSTDRSLVKAALLELGKAWPASIAFIDLVAAARKTIGETSTHDRDSTDLANALLQAAIAGFLDLRAHRMRFSATPSERPSASALARMQIQSSNRAASLQHQIIQLEDAVSRELLQLLDGTRNRESLRAALNEALRSGTIAGPSLPTSVTESDLESALLRFAKLGLLHEES